MIHKNLNNRLYYWLLPLVGFISVPGMARPLSRDSYAWVDGLEVIARSDTGFLDNIDDDMDDSEYELVPGQDVDSNELDLTQEELRPKVNQAISLNFGVSIPWQSYGGSFATRASDQAMHVFSLGGGHSKLSGTEKEGAYEIGVNYRSFFYSWRVFPTQVIPLFIEPSLGFGTWEGRIKPEGSDPITDTDTSKLDAGFSVAGPMAGVGMGLVWFFESHWFVEYNLFNVGKAFIRQEHFTETTSATRVVVRDNLERALSWGLANFRIGYYF